MALCLGSTGRIYAYSGATVCTGSVLRRHQEEGWYEEAAYHPGSKGQQEAHAEPALLVQPLTGTEASGPLGTSENERLDELAHECRANPHRTSRIESCMRYVSLLGDALGVIKKGWRALKSAAHAAWRFVGEQTVSWSEFESRVKKIFGIGKEIFSLAKCTYELFYAKGPCGSP